MNNDNDKYEALHDKLNEIDNDLIFRLNNINDNVDLKYHSQLVLKIKNEFNKFKNNIDVCDLLF